MTDHLRVLTFNIWSTPVVAIDVIDRLNAFLDHVNQSDYDIIGFQEVYLYSNLLRSGLATRGLPYFVLFTSGNGLPLGASGSGCAIASRYPIIETSFKQFSTAGSFLRIDHCDAYAGKGIGLARIFIPESNRGKDKSSRDSSSNQSVVKNALRTVDVFVSHFVAQYSDIDDIYKDQRLLNALESALFIRACSKSDLSLLCVDLNANPNDLVYKALTFLTGFQDAYSSINGKNSIQDATFGLEGNIYTSSTEIETQNQSLLMRFINSIRSLLTQSSPDSALLKCDDNSRLDYILFTATSSLWKVKSADIRLDKTFLLNNGKQANYSDHCAVSSVFSTTISSNKELLIKTKETRSRSLSKTKETRSRSLTKTSTRTFYTEFELFDEITMSLIDGINKSTKKATLQHLISIICFIISILVLSSLKIYEEVEKERNDAMNGVIFGLTFCGGLVFVFGGLMISEIALTFGVSLVLVSFILMLLFSSIFNVISFLAILLMFISVLCMLLSTISTKGEKKSFQRGLEEFHILKQRYM
jgi:exonuclease III